MEKASTMNTHGESTRRTSMNGFHPHRETITGYAVDDKDTIEYMVESPLRCGFLLAFCRHQYNVENLSFLIEVMRYKDILAFDRSAWPSNWQSLDKQWSLQDDSIEDDNSDNTVKGHWPSIKVNRIAAVEAAKRICNDFLIGTAAHEICISELIRRNTMKRVAMINIYGPDVFAEATIDPIKTLRKDILPRFLQSDDFMQMKKRLESCNPLPSGEDLSVPPPEYRIIDDATLEDFPSERRFDLKEILKCQILYTEFLQYVRAGVCSENLICFRMILTFEELQRSGDDEKLNLAREEAWTIYRYFVAAGSAYEVSLSYLHRKKLMQTMAQPEEDMFIEVKKSVILMLRQNFDAFKSTPQYEGLADLVRERKEAQVKAQKAGFFNCFGS